MARIIGTLKLNRFDKDMRLLEHTEQPMRSWTKGLVEILYTAHAQPSAGAPYAALGDIDKTTRNIYNQSPNAFFGTSGRDLGRVAAPPGFAPIYMLNNTATFPTPIGCDLGIQIGSGTPTVTPADMRLAHRFGHGSHAVDGADAVYDEQNTGDVTQGSVTVSNTQMQAQPFLCLHDCRCDNVSLKLYKTGSPTAGLTVEIRSFNVSYDGASQLTMVPGPTALATVTVPASSISAGSPGSFVTCTFSSPVDLYANHIYFINIWSSGVDGSDYYSWRLNNNNITAYERLFTPNTSISNQGSFYANTNNGWTGNSGNLPGAFMYVVNAQSQGEFEYGGCELINRVQSGTNDAFDIRRFFYNRSGSNLTVGEIGINSMYTCYLLQTVSTTLNIPCLIAHDTMGTPVTVNNTQVLEVTYTIQTQT
jgi:hypothetical protein